MEKVVTTRMTCEDVKSSTGRILVQREYVSEIKYGQKEVHRKSYFLIRSESGSTARYGEKTEIFHNGHKVTKVNLLTGDIES